MSTHRSPIDVRAASLSGRGRALTRAIVTATTLLAAVTPGASAQELRLLTELPGSEPFACPEWWIPAGASREAREAARGLASQANEALVLGDLPRAHAFLARALELDGGSAELLYRYARVLEEEGDRAEAIVQLCRVVTVGAGTAEVADAQSRLDSLVALDRPVIDESAVAAWERGLSAYEAGQLAAAGAAFESALNADPTLAPAAYNAGVAWANRGEQPRAMQQFRHYLELAPDAPNAVEVSRVIGRWEAASNQRLPSPGAALAVGLFLPGTGQFYSGRPWTGVGVLALASGAVATGLLVRKVTVRCLGTGEQGGSCPPDRVVGRITRRPYLGGSLVVAGLVSAAGAFEAWYRARGARDGPPLFSAGPDGSLQLRLTVP